ncbi:hypothetical protein GCM10028777_32290 [Angustibacter speluncae]
MLDALGALVPSIGVGLLFWFAIRAMINADRRERAALAKLDAAEREMTTEMPPRASAPHSD